MTNTENKDKRLIQLEDGRELQLNLNDLSWREVRELMAGAFARDEDERQEKEWRYAELLGRAVGLEAEAMLALGFVDFSRIERRVADFIRDPLGADPN